MRAPQLAAVAACLLLSAPRSVSSQSTTVTLPMPPVVLDEGRDSVVFNVKLDTMPTDDVTVCTSVAGDPGNVFFPKCCSQRLQRMPKVTQATQVAMATKVAKATKTTKGCKGYEGYKGCKGYNSYAGYTIYKCYKGLVG